MRNKIMKKFALVIVAAFVLAMLAGCGGGSGGSDESGDNGGSGGGSYSDLMIMPGAELVNEEYAIAFRVGSDAAPEVGSIIKELNGDGTLAAIAEKYGLATALMSNEAMDGSFVDMGRTAPGDLDYIKSKGAITIGITIFEPMNYYDAGGKLVGFDTEFAEAVCAKLGLTPDFQEINWDTKEIELAAQNIDCIWNGLTVTDERRANMEFTYSYINNKQVVVIRKADADKYPTVESLAGARLTAEISSAGEAAIMDDDILADAPYTAMPKQTDTLMEVKAGTSDAAVLDFTLANSLVG